MTFLDVLKPILKKYDGFRGRLAEAVGWEAPLCREAVGNRSQKYDGFWGFLSVTVGRYARY